MVTCLVEGCSNLKATRGWCKLHYERWRKTGTTDPNPNPKFNRAPLEVRLWRHVRRGEPHECWEWQGKSVLDGYGYICTRRRGRAEKAHRVAWELTNGPIPPGEGFHGFVVMHLCDNRKCCNPAHLKLGTQAENMRDMHRKGRNSGPFGDTHKNAKLTCEAVREIRAANDWTRDREFAAKFGVNPRTIYDVRRRKLWKHVE
jgi:hypothetical protein